MTDDSSGGPRGRSNSAGYRLRARAANRGRRTAGGRRPLLRASAVAAVAAAAGSGCEWAGRLDRGGRAVGDAHAPATDVPGDLAAVCDLAVAWSSVRWSPAGTRLRGLLAAARAARAGVAGRWPALAACADLRRHPWRVCATVTVAAAVASLWQFAMARSATSPMVWAAWRPPRW